MRKIIKIFLSILILVIIAALALPFLIPADKMKGQVLARIEEATGRKVSINKISLSLFPNIALKAEGVSIGNPAWAGGGDMADIKQLRLGIELMPLLHKQVNIQDLTLQSPVITLIKNGNQANWQFGNQEHKANEQPTRNKGDAEQVNITIPDHISIKNGKLVYKDSASGTHVLEGLDLTLKAPNPSEKIDLTASMDIDGNKADAVFSAVNPLTITKGKPSDVSAKLSYGNIKLTWDGTLALIDNRPVLTGKVNLPLLDTNALGSKPKNTASQGAAASPAAGEHWSNAPLNFSGLGSADADLDITIGSLVLSKTTLNNIVADMRLHGGILNLKINPISAYDGTLTLALDATSASRIAASATTTHIQVEPLLHDFANSDKLSGVLDGDLKVTSQGASERALVSALDGQGKFVLKDGKMKGINIAAMARNISTAFQGGGAQNTDFSELSGTITIKNGIVSNTDLNMNSPLLRATGTGTVDLPRWQVQYLLQPKIVASLEGQGGKDASGIVVPIHIEGDLSNPRYRPDIQSAIQQNLKDPQKLKDTVNQFKKNLGGNLQNLLR